ncbi:MAG: PEP-CTERM sorting domain-containing protein [Candidatus Scalindua sp.]|nr:PEP-CTERM sorting domain-containing protein [Candidatus Scalindua sp.]
MLRKGVKMKKVIVLVVLMVMGYSIQAQGGLITIGTATYDDGFGGGAEDYNLIWDDDNNGNSVVWLDYEGGGDWADQNAWAAGLDGALTYNIYSGYTVTWDDLAWRLPTTPGTTVDYTSEGEIGHLYYTELGNSAGSLSNTAPFQNLSGSAYWYGTEYNTSFAWVYTFSTGYQSPAPKGNTYSMLTVRSGDVSAAEPVPEPTTVVLLGIGLAGLAGVEVRRRRKKRAVDKS